MNRIEKEEETSEKLPEEISNLIEKRKQARNEKNWQESDRIREEIQQKGYIVKDTKDGMEVSKK